MSFPQPHQHLPVFFAFIFNPHLGEQMLPECQPPIKLGAVEIADVNWDYGRSERIRTSGPCLPKTVLYQAELHSDCKWKHKGSSYELQGVRGHGWE